MSKRKAKAPEEPAPEVLPAPEPPPKVVGTLVWEGITIEVTYSPRDIMAHAHLELRIPTKEPIPVTETGYRSQFLPAGTVEELGGPLEYTRMWLDGSAKSRWWKAQQHVRNTPKQLDLFA